MLCAVLGVSMVLSMTACGSGAKEETTAAQTTAAANTIIQIYMHFFDSLIKYEAIIGAFPQTTTASAAEFFGNIRFAIGMLFGLAGTGTTTHTDIFDGTAESRHLVALKMGQTDKNVSVHDGASDLGFCDIFAAIYGDVDIVSTLETVTDDNGTTHGERGETVLPGTFQMFQSIFSASGIHRIKIGRASCRERVVCWV